MSEHPLFREILAAHGAPEARVLPEAPHWNGVGKYGPALVCDQFVLHIYSRGFGAKDGSGDITINSDHLEYERDEDGKEYVSVPVSNSDLLFLRDQLNKLFPAALTSTSTVAVEGDEVEKVAKALCRACGRDPDAILNGVPEWVCRQVEARAAIDALTGKGGGK